MVIEFIPKDRGVVSLPEEQRQLCLNPVERTLFRLFLLHPEGISADDLLLHWPELCRLYEKESRYDDKPLRDSAMESLCGESKSVFYATVSRIKKKFVGVLGPFKADDYIIQRDSQGLYRIRGLRREV